MTLTTGVARLAPHVDARLVRICVLLLAVDVFFIVVFSIHTIYVLLYNDRVPILGDKWNIVYDRSYAEMFGYLKTALILSLLISIPQVWKRPIYLAFAGIFTFVLVDDALRVHERFGLLVARALDLQPFLGLRPVDPGELMVWTIAGIPLLAGAVAAFVRSPAEDRGNGLLLAAALAVLALFVVVIDMAHIVLRRAFRGADDLFTVIEDGGEQFALSLTCGLAILIWREVRERELGRVTPP
jgi:zinc transporter ZupT